MFVCIHSQHLPRFSIEESAYTLSCLKRGYCLQLDAIIQQHTKVYKKSYNLMEDMREGCTYIHILALYQSRERFRECLHFWIQNTVLLTTFGPWLGISHLCSFIAVEHIFLNLLAYLTMICFVSDDTCRRWRGYMLGIFVFFL
jgi:hypothetical protein